MTDPRLHKGLPGRESRGMQDSNRSNSGLVSTDPSFSRALAEKFIQEALPDVPKIPGFHTCWLSTTSQYDPIHKRLRMGYVPVQAEDVPGFDHLKVKSGEQVGLISVNEMVLYKIPEEVYQAVMQHFHHNEPNDAQQALSMRDEQQLAGLKDRNGRPLVSREYDQSAAETPVPVPVFE